MNEKMKESKIDAIFRIDKLKLLEKIIFFNPNIDTAPK